MHNHRKEHVSTIQKESRNEINNEIKKSKDSFSINLPKLVQSMSVDKRIKAPSFYFIKTSLYNKLSQ